MPTTSRPLARLVDTVLEATIAPSFTRVGSWTRSRVEGWEPLDSHDLSGRRIVVTGATSGLGRAATTTLVSLGATVVAVGRDERRLAELAAASDRVVPERADLADLEAVEALAGRIAAGPTVDTVIHNAGALLAERHVSPQGLEVTIASQVVAPFLLTRRLLPDLALGARIITMSSGGMYSAPLTVDGLQMPRDRYDGTRQYALAKRAQVTLNEMWAERVDPAVATFAAAHPGWADTPGVAESLPTFRKVVGPLLRTPEDGADTVAWLAATDDMLERSGAFWHDRRVRAIHRLASTRRSDTPERRERLWAWVDAAAGPASSSPTG